MVVAVTYFMSPTLYTLRSSEHIPLSSMTRACMFHVDDKTIPRHDTSNNLGIRTCLVANAVHV